MFAAVLGWIGTFGTFGAYVLLWRGWVTSTSYGYAFLNILGGLMAGVASVLYEAWPSAASNMAWAGLGVLSLISMQRKRIRRVANTEAV